MTYEQIKDKLLPTLELFWDIYQDWSSFIDNAAIIKTFKIDDSTTLSYQEKIEKDIDFLFMDNEVRSNKKSWINNSLHSTANLYVRYYQSEFNSRYPKFSEFKKQLDYIKNNSYLTDSVDHCLFVYDTMMKSYNPKNKEKFIELVVNYLFAYIENYKKSNNTKKVKSAEQIKIADAIKLLKKHNYNVTKT